jgi:hypothetical protein
MHTDSSAKTASFGCHQNQGFQMTFENGYTVSVQFGCHHYCAMRDLNSGFDSWRSADAVHTSPDAEVAVIDPRGEFVVFSSTNDFVLGHVPPDKVASIIAWAASLPKDQS